MDKLVEDLNAEYRKQHKIVLDATGRMDKIIALLGSYGYGLPEPEDIKPNSEATPLLATTGLQESYPKIGTVRDKVLFLLKIKREQYTVTELVDRVIQLYEPDGDRKKLIKTFTQVCSSLGVKGLIDVEEGYRNKYSYKKK